MCFRIVIAIWWVRDRPAMAFNSYLTRKSTQESATKMALRFDGRTNVQYLPGLRGGVPWRIWRVLRARRRG